MLGGQLIIALVLYLYYHQSAVCECYVLCLPFGCPLNSLVGEMKGNDRECEEN